MKTQTIRLIDVFLLGPFMIYAAAKPQLTPLDRIILAIIGIATILYNWKNYKENI